MCACTYTHTHMHMHTHTQMHPHAHAHAHTQHNTHTHTHTHTHTISHVLTPHKTRTIYNQEPSAIYIHVAKSHKHTITCSDLTFDPQVFSFYQTYTPALYCQEKPLRQWEHHVSQKVHPLNGEYHNSNFPSSHCRSNNSL